MNINKLAITGTVFLALGTVGASPATAALLEFDFNTASGGIGSFTLDTDTTPDPEPARLFNPDGSVGAEGFQYRFALSDFSFSSADAGTVAFADGDLALFPTVPFSADGGALSFIGAPASLDPDLFPIVQLNLEYTGDLAILPSLSEDPSSYASLGNILVFESAEFTADLVAFDSVTELDVQVSSAQSVPESHSILSLLAIAGGAGLGSRKRVVRH